VQISSPTHNDRGKFKLKQKIEIPNDLQIIIKYLQSSSSKLRIKPGILNGGRIEYFKGKHAANALCRDTFNDKSIKVDSIDTACTYLSRILELNLMVKLTRDSNKDLVPIYDNSFSLDGYYIWLYRPTPVTATLLGIGILGLVFLGVMYPLWPSFMKTGVYYLSVSAGAFLAFVAFLGVLRLVIYIVLILTIKRGGWLFPDLFADKGVIESFTPLWSWDKKRKQKSKLKSE
jgi:translocation protein SEC62